MKRVRYKIYLTTGAIVSAELLATGPTTGLSDICRQLKDGLWYIFRLVDGATVCINPAQVTHVAAEEIEE